MTAGILLLLAAAPYGTAERIAYVEATIQAFGDAKPQEIRNIEQYIYAAHKNQCQAPLVSLKVSCLMEAARRNCNQWRRRRRKTCDRISDVIMSNRLSEARLVPRRLRHQIMRQHRNYRPALEAELRRRHAGLAIEMSMSEPIEGRLAKAVEQYCTARARRRDLAWQHCVAAITWFIGTSEQEKP